MRGTLLFIFFLPCGAMQCCRLSRDVAELVPWLHGQEASRRVIDHLTSLGLETKADLATYCIVPTPDAELAQLWRCARDEPFLGVAAAVEVSRAQMHNQAKTKTQDRGNKSWTLDLPTTLLQRSIQSSSGTGSTVHPRSGLAETASCANTCGHFLDVGPGSGSCVRVVN